MQLPKLEEALTVLSNDLSFHSPENIAVLAALVEVRKVQQLAKIEASLSRIASRLEVEPVRSP